MIALVCLGGVTLASLAHLYVARHHPPPGWSWVVAGYEIAVPATLLGAVYFPAARANLLGFASSLAILVGLASIVAARITTDAIADMEKRAAIPTVWRDLDEERRRLERAQRGARARRTGA
jgi:hypothetical protein